MLAGKTSMTVFAPWLQAFQCVGIVISARVLAKAFQILRSDLIGKLRISKA